MFEAFAIRVLQACSSVKQAATLLRLDWDTVQGIMKRAVERGLERRETEQITQIGIDEKSFLRGHNYVSVMTDISGSHVLEVNSLVPMNEVVDNWIAALRCNQHLLRVSRDPIFLRNFLGGRPDSGRNWSVKRCF